MGLAEVERWFFRAYGRRPREGEVKVGTLDNPGWMFVVRLPDAPQDRVIVGCDPNDPDEAWIDVRLRGGTFQANSGPRQLGELIGHLLAYPGLPRTPPPSDASIACLVEWYYSRCDRDWEHQGGLRITSLGNGWSLELNLNAFYRPEPTYKAPLGGELRLDDDLVKVQGPHSAITDFLLELRPLPPGTNTGPNPWM